MKVKNGSKRVDTNKNCTDVLAHEKRTSLKKTADQNSCALMAVKMRDARREARQRLVATNCTPDESTSGGCCVSEPSSLDPIFEASAQTAPHRIQRMIVEMNGSTGCFNSLVCTQRHRLGGISCRTCWWKQSRIDSTSTAVTNTTVRDDIRG